MRRLVFIVEGDSEIRLVDKLIIPFLVGEGYNVVAHAQTITTNRKQHKKGGVSSYGLYRNEIERTLAQGNVLVTTFVDYFKLPTDFPAYSGDSLRISEIEQAILQDFNNNPNLIPYIQRHELEALMFSSMAGFDFVVDEALGLDKIRAIHEQYDNPEDINEKPETAPSKRMESCFNYDKTNDAELIFEMMDIQEIIQKCPRFATWLNIIKERLN